MALEVEQAADAVDAVEATSQVETEGSGSSPEAAETRSPAEIARDIFLEKYGSDEPEPAEAAEPEATDPKPEAASEPARQEGPEDPKAPRIPDDVFKALPPIARERIGYLTSQAQKARADLETATRQAQEYEPGYQATQSLRHFAETNNLQSEDITNGLAIMAKLTMGDHEGFLAAIEPFYQQARRATGKAISPEIQALVDSGDVTETAALRMSQAEERRALAEATAARERTARTTQTEQTAQQAHAQALDTAARNAEAALRISDPDFALKEPAIREQFKEALEYGWRPKNAADVDAMIRKLHARALVAPKPALQSTQPRPGASTTPTRKPAPRTTLEAVEMAFAEKAPR